MAELERISGRRQYIQLHKVLKEDVALKNCKFSVWFELNIYQKKNIKIVGMWSSDHEGPVM